MPLGRLDDCNPEPAPLAQYGAAGGDTLTFAGSGLDPTEPDLYKCVFRDMASGVIKNSTLSTAASPTEVSCVTPVWGDVTVASNTTVQLYEAGELVEDHYKDRITRINERWPQVSTNCDTRK